MNLQGSLVQELTKGLKAAAEKTEIPDPIKWIEKEFIIPETRNDPVLRGRLQLVDYQKDALAEALSRDGNGNFKYSIIIWSDIKKSIKSTLAAAVNLYRATFTEFGEFYVVANDLKQANSRVSEYIRRCVQLNPKMQKKYQIQGYRVTTPSGSFIEAVPIDPSGEAGSNADQVTFSELWGSNEDAKRRMWSEMTIPPAKYGKAFRWIESYAGYVKESELLYSLYDLGVRQGQLLWPDRLYNVTDGSPTVLELYVNREAGMLCLWNTQPRCPWQTKEYYSAEAQILLPNEFARIHRNQWVSSTENFVPIEWWYACKHTAEDWPVLDFKKQNMIIVLDAGVSSDNFGLLMGCRHPASPNDVLIVYSQKWVPDQGKKIDFQGTEENPGPEKVLRKLIKDYRVIEVAYDEFQLHDMATRLTSEGLAWFHQFSQTGDRLIADSQYRRMIMDRRIWHRGEPDLEDHMRNADAKVDSEDRKIRIVKRSEKLKIDLTICGSMLSHELMRLNL